MSNKAATQPVYTSLLDPNNPTIRQQLIRKIQNALDGKLITYTASPNHPYPTIMMQDAKLLEDLLRGASEGRNGYLMITSPGGDPNAAEKLCMMCRERFSEGFYVIVPDYAKSAATLIALGSDKILMGYLAELGPIDPQIQQAPIPGASLPARAFIDGLEYIRNRVKNEGDPPTMYYPMLTQIQPHVIAICESAIENSKATAEKLLKQYTLAKDPKQAECVASWLSDGKTYRPHGKVISYDEVKQVLKLNVEKLDPQTELWNDIWELYLRSSHFLQTSGVAKLLESEKTSLNMVIQVSVAPRLGPPRPRLRPREPEIPKEEGGHLTRKIETETPSAFFSPSS